MKIVPSSDENGELRDLPLRGGDALSYVGVNIGALTVKVVALPQRQGDQQNSNFEIRNSKLAARVVSHQGRPLEVLKELLAAVFADGEFFGVSGHLGHISEVAAIQRALARADAEHFDAVVSLGGESFLVYLLTDGRITNVSVAQQMCRRAAASFSCSRSAGWGWTSTRRSGARSRARSCRWLRAARFIANRTSRTSSTATRPRRRTFCTRCTIAWPAKWLRCWRKDSANCGACC